MESESQRKINVEPNQNCGFVNQNIKKATYIPIPEFSPDRPDQREKNKDQRTEETIFYETLDFVEDPKPIFVRKIY